MINTETLVATVRQCDAFGGPGWQCDGWGAVTKEEAVFLACCDHFGGSESGEALALRQQLVIVESSE
jgi:hypothetical protein